MAVSKYYNVLLLALSIVLILSPGHSFYDKMCIIVNSNDSASDCQRQCCFNVSIDTISYFENISSIHLYVWSEIILTKNVVFRNQTKVTIEGIGRFTGFNCLNNAFGVRFIDVQMVKLKNFSINQCQLKKCEQNNSKLHIKNASDAPAILITSTSSGMACSADIFNVEVSKSRGVGIEFINVRNISVHSADFMNNRRQGMKVSFASEHDQDILLHYNLSIKNCNFGRNNNDEIKSIITTYGGGLLVNILAHTYSAIIIKYTTFKENFAGHGGGVAILYNQAPKLYNKFTKCKFYSNKGVYGGGLYIEMPGNYPSQSEFNQNVTFESCVWMKNNGVYGSALNVRPQSSSSNIQHSAAAIFTNCKFDENSSLLKPYGQIECKKEKGG